MSKRVAICLIKDQPWLQAICKDYQEWEDKKDAAKASFDAEKRILWDRIFAGLKENGLGEFHRQNDALQLAKDEGVLLHCKCDKGESEIDLVLAAIKKVME